MTVGLAQEAQIRIGCSPGAHVHGNTMSRTPIGIGDPDSGIEVG